MKLGCNYSDPLMSLLAAGAVDVDAIKMGYFGPFDGLHDKVMRLKPILIHGFGWHEHIGMVNPDKRNDWDLMNRVMDRYDQEHLQVHFSVFEEEMQSRRDPKWVLEEGIKIFMGRIKKSIMIENMDFNPMYNRLCTLKESVDPELIGEIAQTYDLDILLDTAHASVSAYHMNVDLKAYLKAMPLHKVKEIHFTGTMLTQDQGLKDMHNKVSPKELELLDWLLQRCQPEVLTLEYGWPGESFKWRTDEKDLLWQLSEIRRLFY